MFPVISNLNLLEVFIFGENFFVSTALYIISPLLKLLPKNFSKLSYKMMIATIYNQQNDKY